MKHYVATSFLHLLDINACECKVFTVYTAIKTNYYVKYDLKHSSTHQELDLPHAEGVRAADVISQSSWRRYHHMWLVGQLQGLRHHVYQQHSTNNVSTGNLIVNCSNCILI